VHLKCELLDVIMRSRPIRKLPICGGFHGASRTRTGDLLGAIQALSQLSYSPARGEV
jgi:hypothetical protein